MSYDYNAKDILEMAIQIEKNGAVFYRNAAESLANTSHKQLLLDLASMEDQHEQIFDDMKASLSEEEKKRIELVETYKFEVKDKLEYQKARKFGLGMVYSFFNSKFGLWVLSAIFV